MLTGKHLTAGQWGAGEATFRSSPASGALTCPTGLPAARLKGERGRATSQLRLFASHIRRGDYLDRRHDAAQPDRKPAPRPDMRMMQRPIGPVAVFGASTFPLAFPTAGGDTASALAACCPVVVKGRSAHPGHRRDRGAGRCGRDQGAGPASRSVSSGAGGKRDAGESLVRHPLIKAVGFTGSLGGGLALFDLCARRPEPIPFFGELGSVNPMFLLPHPVEARGEAIAKGWAGSLTLGAGQFCTNPGIVTVRDASQMLAVAQGLQGQLTCTTHLDDADTAEALTLMPVLERKAGRVVANGFPTGDGGRRCPSPWRALPGEHQFRRDLGRHAVDPPLAAPRGLSEHARRVATADLR